MKKTIITLVVIVAVVALLALPKYFKSQKSNAPVANANPTAQALSVDATLVSPVPFDKKLIVTGSVLANEQVDIKSEASGKILKIYFTEGQAVKKGDPLIKIDDDELLAQLDKQKANKKLNEDNEFRQRKLLEKEAISQEEYDNALNRLKTTEADIRLLQAQLAKTTVRAPFNGYIGFRFVSEGAFISPSFVITTLYNLDPAKIEFSIPAKHAARVAVGNKIFFTIENDTTHHQGQVYAVESQIEASTRTLKIRATTPNPNKKMLPGQFVSIQLVLEHLDKAIMVPTEAVVPQQDGNKVFMLKGGKVAEVNVTAGERTERTLEILSGLQVGDTILTSGILQLKSGMKVSIANLN